MDIEHRTASYLREFWEHEDETLRAARARSEEADIQSVSRDTGGLLRFFARVLDARNVVEIGSGGGYSGLWLLGGMDPRGHLTTIEVEPDHQALAQRAFAEAKVADRVRTILGNALAVLPKLADDAYDIVFLDALPAEYPEYLEHARRLLRSGGLLLAANALRHVAQADTTGVDDAEGMFTFNTAVHEDPAFHAQLFPAGGGLLAAVYAPAS